MKRAFDIVASGFALTLLCPLMLVIAILVKLDSPGPVLFRQRRLGKGMQVFEICKFRTMRVGAEAVGPGITVNGDSRVTRVGRILRRFDLDELPSLFNVLKGHMSIVGPRPEVPKFLQYYTNEQKRLFSIKPGLTDLSTLMFRNEAIHLSGEDPEECYIREVLPQKLALSLEYFNKQSFRYDLTIVVRTLGTIFFQPKLKHF